MEALEISPDRETATEQLPLFASTTRVLLGHRDRIKAGVPGCTCGTVYPDDSHGHYPVLHARHLSDVLVRHVLAAAAVQLEGAPLDDVSRREAVTALRTLVRAEIPVPA